MGRQSASKCFTPRWRDAGPWPLQSWGANATASIPNVAAIYDFSETPDDLLYLAMQYIEGQTLTHIMKARGAARTFTRRLSCARRQGILTPHAMGIVHRDLKPTA
jgi:serine/threonine protein kinase